MDLTTRSKLTSALLTQLHIHKAIQDLEHIGLLVEPELTTSRQPHNICNHLFDALTSNSDNIYRYFNMTLEPSRREAFDAAIEDFSRTADWFSPEMITAEFFTPHYSMIKNDYNDNESTFIDAWFTTDDNEEGHTIAKINNETLEVEYIDKRASYDDMAEKMIVNAIAKIKQNQRRL